MSSESKITLPTDREYWGFACLLTGRDTGVFENGCRQPWRDVGQEVRSAPLESRLTTLREMLGRIPGIEIETFLIGVNAFDPTGPQPEHDEGDGAVSTLPLPAEFPIDALPATLRDYVLEGSESLRCPPDYIAVPILAAAGVAVGTTVRVQIKVGWYELPSLYTAVVAPSGSKKSPALDLAVAFTRAKGHEYLLSHQADLKNFERLEMEYQAQRDARPKPKGGGERLPLPDKPVRPVLSRTWVDDSTLEALAQKLQQNPRGLAIARDELAALLLSFNQYRNGRGADPQFLLSTWSSQPTAIDRKQEPNLVILHRPLVGIVGTIQPAVLVKVFGGDRLHDGFAARFLFSDPLVLPYRSSEAIISEATRRRAHDLIMALYGIHHANPFSDPPEPQMVRLTPEARQVFTEFEEWIGTQLDRLSSDDPYGAPLSKLPGYLGRIAIILHVCDRVSTDPNGFAPVEAGTMQAAVRIARYFESHAQRVWRRLCESTEDSQMRRAHNWFVRKGRPVTAREMNQHGVAGIKDSREAATLLQRLVDCGLVDPIKMGQTTRYKARKAGCRVP